MAESEHQSSLALRVLCTISKSKVRRRESVRDVTYHVVRHVSLSDRGAGLHGALCACVTSEGAPKTNVKREVWGGESKQRGTQQTRQAVVNSGLTAQSHGNSGQFKNGKTNVIQNYIVIVY